MSNLLDDSGWGFYWFTLDMEGKLPAEAIKASWFNLQLCLGSDCKTWQLIDWQQNKVLVDDVAEPENWTDACYGLTVLRDYLS
jgi:hypothetical protein